MMSFNKSLAVDSYSNSNMAQEDKVCNKGPDRPLARSKGSKGHRAALGGR
ncbi:unnamed protein product [Ceutorhynchus assimilis]|uniref:Uncharacterized protein n=1 Tax=Ceutorhynchus assimilis TaxID=467358 RepID=A0A9P0DM83_9CUCU|nr:unnamed protein product [Ceutorhynchus assimilis]